MLGVVKACGYGSSSIEVSKLLEKLGIDYFAVAYVNEGVELRKAGINSELYPDSAKMKKQMNYANKKNIPYVVLVGEDEMNSGLLTVKNMKDGSQSNFNLVDFIKLLKS